LLKEWRILLRKIASLLIKEQAEKTPLLTILEYEKFFF